MKITSFQYIDYLNNFLSLQGYADYYGYSLAQASSIVARSKVVWLSENHDHRTFFTNNCLNLCDHYKFMSVNNAKVFCANHSKRLLSECSA